MDEQPRPDANAEDQAYTLTVEEAATMYEAAGHARTLRAIQKYCFRGDLTAIREQTTYGERYRITPASVARHIEQIEQLSQAHRREQPRPDASVRIEEADHQSEKNDSASVREQSRPTIAMSPMSKGRIPIYATKTRKRISSLSVATAKSKR